MTAREATTVEELRSILLSSGFISTKAILRPLAGGVSSIIAQVADGDDQWVAKTPLHRLKVADEWLADRSRSGNEGAILGYLDGKLEPVATPKLRFYDEPSSTIGEEYFAGPPPTYKDLLLSGSSRPEVSSALGSALTNLQGLSQPTELFGDAPRQLFRQLRLEPFYLATATALPQQRGSLETLAEETLLASSQCLVHGDFTPKNVLVDADRTVLLDWECVHVGDPAFDPATLLAHLVLKALRDVPREVSSKILFDAKQFVSSYAGPAHADQILRHTGAMMLSRLYGKSPVEYLTDNDSRSSAHDIGVLALNGVLSGFDEFFEAAANSSSLRKDA
jgi:Phosphotransferase enzyme family